MPLVIFFFCSLTSSALEISDPKTEPPADTGSRDCCGRCFDPCNCVKEKSSSTCCGCCNYIEGTNSEALYGCCNKIEGSGVQVTGACCNKASGLGAQIAGSCCTRASGIDSKMSCGFCSGVSGQDSATSCCCNCNEGNNTALTSGCCVISFRPNWTTSECDYPCFIIIGKQAKPSARNIDHQDSFCEYCSVITSKGPTYCLCANRSTRAEIYADWKTLGKNSTQYRAVPRTQEMKDERN